MRPERRQRIDIALELNPIRVADGDPTSMLTREPPGADPEIWTIELL
jgi:hypothetical protein